MKGKKYNLLVDHSRFNYDEIRKIMPEDTIYITILRYFPCYYNLFNAFNYRNPVEQFASMYDFGSLDKYYNFKLENIDENSPKLKERIFYSFGPNMSMFHFGYDDDQSNESVINDRINHLDKVFDLVLIQERMDESLVLLQKLLCWKSSDMVVFKASIWMFSFLKCFLSR